MITEKDIEVFIDGIKHYFKTSTEIDIVVEAPFLIAVDEIAINDYTGIIGVSGERKGFVLVTSSEEMLQDLVLNLGEAEATPNLVYDVIGELANTVSGNARRFFGAGFMISVPLIVMGQPDRIGSIKDTHGYVIPARWNDFPFQMVVSLM